MNLNNLITSSSSFGKNSFQNTSWYQEQYQTQNFIILPLRDDSNSSKTAAIIGAGQSLQTNTTITIPKKITYNREEYNITKIGDYAFALGFDDSGNLLEEDKDKNTEIQSVIFLGNPIIGKNCFLNCKNLTSLTWKNEGSIETITIQDYAFKGCGFTNLTILKKWELGTGAFCDNESLTKLTFEDSITKIPGECFKDCFNLHRITFSSVIEKIGEQAFYNCYNLGTIILPKKNLLTVGDSCFKVDDGYNQPVVFLLKQKPSDYYYTNVPYSYFCDATAAFYSKEGLEKRDSTTGASTVSISFADGGNAAFFKHRIVNKNKYPIELNSTYDIIRKDYNSYGKSITSENIDFLISAYGEEDYNLALYGPDNDNEVSHAYLCDLETDEDDYYDEQVQSIEEQYGTEIDALAEKFCTDGNAPIEKLVYNLSDDIALYFEVNFYKTKTDNVSYIQDIDTYNNVRYTIFINYYTYLFYGAIKSLDGCYNDESLRAAYYNYQENLFYTNWINSIEEKYGDNFSSLARITVNNDSKKIYSKERQELFLNEWKQEYYDGKYTVNEINEPQYPDDTEINHFNTYYQKIYAEIIEDTEILNEDGTVPTAEDETNQLYDYIILTVENLYELEIEEAKENAKYEAILNLVVTDNYTNIDEDVKTQYQITTGIEDMSTLSEDKIDTDLLNAITNSLFAEKVAEFRPYCEAYREGTLDQSNSYYNIFNEYATSNPLNTIIQEAINTAEFELIYAKAIEEFPVDMENIIEDNFKNFYFDEREDFEKTSIEIGVIQDDTVEVDSTYNTLVLQLDYSENIVEGLFSNLPIQNIIIAATNKADSTKSIRIEENAFKNCDQLEHLYFTSDVNISSIDKNAFQNCKKLQSVILPTTLKSLKEGAFSNCTALDTVIFNSSLQEIGEECFLECDNLRDIDLSITQITDGLSAKAFKSCDKIASVLLPTTITNIPEECFSGCQLTGDFDLSSLENLIEIQDNAFYGGTFETVTLPANIKAIYQNAFSGCTFDKIDYSAVISKETQTIKYAPTWGGTLNG